MFRSRSCPKEPNSKIFGFTSWRDEQLTSPDSNHGEQLWIWNFDEERLFYDNHEMVRFQIVDEEWHDQAPAGPSQADDAPPKTPYRIKASMAAEGLGVCLWWDGA